MISFTKPNNFDGGKLIEELLAAGIKVGANVKYPFGATPPELDGNSVLWLDIEEADKDKAQAVLDNH